jgi:FtsK/SpoIIIE family
MVTSSKVNSRKSSSQRPGVSWIWVLIGVVITFLLMGTDRPKIIILGVLGFNAWILPVLMVVFPLLRFSGLDPCRVIPWRNRLLIGLFLVSMMVSSAKGIFTGNCDAGGLVGMFFPSYFKQFLGRGGFLVSLALALLLLLVIVVLPVLRSLGVSLPGIGELLGRIRHDVPRGAPGEKPSSPGDGLTVSTPVAGPSPHSKPSSQNRTILSSEALSNEELSFGILPAPVHDEPIPRTLIPLVPPYAGGAVTPETLASLSSTLVDTVRRLTKLNLESDADPEIGMTNIRFSFHKAPGQSYSVSRIEDIAEDLGVETGRTPVRVLIGAKIEIELPLTEDERKFAPIGSLLHDAQPMNPGFGITYLIGRKQDGKAYELPAGPALHLLVGGETGGGKSVLLHTIIWGLIFRYPPSEVRLALYDHKIEEFSSYAGLPHLWQEIVTNEGGFSRMVSNLKEEITRRKLDRKDNPDAEFPWIVVIMDEFRGISDETLVELVAESRSLRIRFILGTQRAEASFISPSIKANLPTGISFRVRNPTESRLIIGVPDACNLLTKGDCIVHAPSGIERVQAGWVRPADLKALREWLQAESRVS